MLLELESAINPTPTNAFIAAVVTLAFYFLSLFSVYHRNQQYQQQKMSANNNKNESKSEATLQSTSKCPVAASINGPINHQSSDKESIIDKNEHFKKNNGIFDAKAIISGKMRNRRKCSSEKGKQKKALPKVEYLGCITIKELNKYDCHHESRQLISIFGTIYDVTSAPDKYSTDGTYKEFAGHDITLCLGTGKLNAKWLDKFVQFEPKHRQCANGWIDFYQMQYPTAGILEKWSENTKKWPKLKSEELNELNAECIIM